MFSRAAPKDDDDVFFSFHLVYFIRTADLCLTQTIVNNSDYSIYQFILLFDTFETTKYNNETNIKTIVARGEKVRKNQIPSGGLILHLILVLISLSIAAYGFQQEEIKKAKIFEEDYELITESDLYCSFYVLDEGIPELKIIGAERGYERDIFSDEDIVYLNQGRNQGLNKGQVFMVIEVRKDIPGIGPVAFRNGRVRIQNLDDTKSTARIEKSCDKIMKGYYIVPFQPKEGVMGKDLGYDIPPFETEGVKGEVVFLETDFNQIGTGHWAIVDIGQQSGITLGQQLILYRILEEEAPLQIFGNCVVIDVQQETSTVKILSCRDAVRIGDLVMVRPDE